MIMASLLTLQRQRHDFSKRWNSLVQLSQGKLNSFERVYQLKNGSLLCEQKSQSEVVLMPHPHVSKVQHREVTRPGASGSMAPIPVFRMCWNSTFCSTGFLSLGICVCVFWEGENNVITCTATCYGGLVTSGSPIACWAPTMCQALYLIQVYTWSHLKTIISWSRCHVSSLYKLILQEVKFLAQSQM